MNKTYKNMIGAIFDASNLVECGQKLVQFADTASKLLPENKLQVTLDAFWAGLAERSTVRLDFGSPDNCGWHICEPNRRIATYLSLELIRQDTPQEDLEFLRKYGAALQENFVGTAACSITEEKVREVLTYLDTKYNFSDRLFSKQRAEFILLPDVHIDGAAANNLCYYAKANLSAPHFSFFGESEVSLMANSMFSPAYFIANGLSAALCAIACAKRGDISNRKTPDAWLDWLAAFDYKDIRESDRNLQEKRMSGIIKSAILYDGPFQGELLDERRKNAADKLPACREFLQMVLASLSD